MKKSLEMLEATSASAPADCCVSVSAEGMTAHDAEVTARVFKALADPNRVRVVNLLATAHDAVCVCDLIEFLDVSQATVSFHMKKLVDAGLLEREQRGVWAYYSLRDDAASRLGDLLRFERRS